MMTIPDYIYERSVRNQLHLDGEKGSLLASYAGGASLIKAEDGSGYEAELSSCLFFHEDEIELSEKDFYSLKRGLLCAGADFTSIRVEILIVGEFLEEKLRKLCREIRENCEKMEVFLRGIGIHRKEGMESFISLTLLGRGKLLGNSLAPYQKQILIPSQGIVVTGSIGRAGSLNLFKKHKKELEGVFPAVFLKKMENRVEDRLPFLETEHSSFFGVTAMIGAEKGGILAALYRFGNREEAGFRIYSERLLFDQETVEISEYFDLDPMKLSSEGVYVMAVVRAEDFVESLRAAGLPAVLAGEVTKEKKRVIVFDGEERFIESPKF